MSYIDILLKISPALEEGKSLANHDTWSNVANTNHALVVVFGFLLVIAKTFNYDIPLSDSQIAELAGAVASVGGTVSMFFHHALNKNSGVKR